MQAKLTSKFEQDLPVYEQIQHPRPYQNLNEGRQMIESKFRGWPIPIDEKELERHIFDDRIDSGYLKSRTIS
jgi:hypothetical protein